MQISKQSSLLKHSKDKSVWETSLNLTFSHNSFLYFCKTLSFRWKFLSGISRLFPLRVISVLLIAWENGCNNRWQHTHTLLLKTHLKP
jgi:hypothetical protein